jgi:WXG100 family type VII secretion target
MDKITIDTQLCRREAERLRQTARDIENIKSRLISLAGGTADVWQGPASSALANTQEYTLAEFSRLITLIDEVADNIERVSAEVEQAERNITGGLV